MVFFLMGIPIIVLLSLLFLWITGFFLVTDLAVPLRETRHVRRVLVIFPHADDETITCGGSLHRLALGGCDVTWLLLTKGERGIPEEKRNGEDREMRVKEARKVAALLSISRLIQKDFGDGLLSEQKPELAACIAEVIERERPDLLITYDLAGFYGHADHIACAEVVTELKQTRFPEIALWYVTFPGRVLVHVKLPADLAIDPNVRARQAAPTHKIWIGGSLPSKIRAWYVYRSQRAALASGIGRFAPFWLLWFFLSMVLFEYFAEVR
jgi:LmbE family N-acetylglucosaminyl deacetylase